MALNGEEGRRRTNNERVERSTAASETSLETYVRVGVTEWKIETRRRAHEVGCCRAGVGTKKGVAIVF